MRIPLAAKVSGIVIMIIGLALGLTVMLNYLKFERTFLDVTESRLGFIAADLRTRIQTGLDLGLDLAAMTNVQPISDAEAGMDPQILAIVVYDEGARILFSSGAEPAGETIPGGWASALEPVEAWTWRADDPEAIVVGSRLTNNFGAYTGGVALRYSRAFLEEVTTSAFDLLVRLAVIIFVVTAVLAARHARAAARHHEQLPAHAPGAGAGAARSPKPSVPAAQAGRGARVRGHRAEPAAGSRPWTSSSSCLIAAATARTRA